MRPAQKPTKTEVVTDFRKAQILEAARESFAADGVAATTVDGIARRAGVAKGTVYLYYKSKDEVLRQILIDDLDHLRDQTVPPILEPGQVEDKLQRFFVSVLEFFDRRRDFFEQIYFEMGADVRHKAQQRLELVSRAQLESWQQALATARSQGELGDVDLHGSALTIVALASGLAKQRLRGCATGPIEDTARVAAATLWKGLEAR